MNKSLNHSMSVRVRMDDLWIASVPLHVCRTDILQQNVAPKKNYRYCYEMVSKKKL